MRITNLSVSNYKSLRQVTWEPGPLTVIVGANASGKSNFADFHDFLANLYRHGLAVAVARKGGYENIAHRKMRRSRGAIDINISTVLTASDLRSLPRQYRTFYDGTRFTHSFSFRAEGAGIRAEFRIEYELIRLERKGDTDWQKLLEIVRTGNELKHKSFDESLRNEEHQSIVRDQFRFLNAIEDFSSTMSSTELMLGMVSRFMLPLRIISDGLGALRVFQISPTNTREFGVPIPNPEMDIHGGNFPAVVDMIVQRHPKIWSRILDVMRQILPGLERIEVDYTHSRTLGLFFHEKGVGRPWTVAEISDGTIHSLALLVAIYDPRTTMLVLEEPENSVHTWILRTLMDAALDAARSKQIMLTTHSRVVVDATSANDVWIMWRIHGESNLAQLQSFDSDVLELIEEGELTTFEVLDTGVIEEALPPSSSD